MPIAVLLFFIGWSLRWVDFEKRSRMQVAMPRAQKDMASIASKAELPLVAAE
jgi:hypothetical protein